MGKIFRRWILVSKGGQKGEELQQKWGQGKVACMLGVPGAERALHRP